MVLVADLSTHSAHAHSIHHLAGVTMVPIKKLICMHKEQIPYKYTSWLCLLSQLLGTKFCSELHFFMHTVNQFNHTNKKKEEFLQISIIIVLKILKQNKNELKLNYNIPVLVHKLLLGNSECAEFVVQWLFILKKKNWTWNWERQQELFPSQLMQPKRTPLCSPWAYRVLPSRILVFLGDVLCPFTVGTLLRRVGHFTLYPTDSSGKTIISCA